MSDTKAKKKYFVIRQIADRKEVKRIDVTKHGERSREKIEMGILRNLNSDDYFVDELEE
jgi:hypothetical protein